MKAERVFEERKHCEESQVFIYVAPVLKLSAWSSRHYAVVSHNYVVVYGECVA